MEDEGHLQKIKQLNLFQLILYEVNLSIEKNITKNFDHISNQRDSVETFFFASHENSIWIIYFRKLFREVVESRCVPHGQSDSSSNHSHQYMYVHRRCTTSFPRFHCSIDHTSNYDTTQIFSKNCTPWKGSIKSWQQSSIWGFFAYSTCIGNTKSTYETCTGNTKSTYEARDIKEHDWSRVLRNLVKQCVIYQEANVDVGIRQIAFINAC